MTWFGTVSAWAAALAGAALAAYAMLWFSAGIVPWLIMLSAALLLTAAFRTLRKMSGGLRLLCGAWGLTAGLFLQNGLMPPESVALRAPAGLGLLLGGLAYLSLIGLALTVLHKEVK